MPRVRFERNEEYAYWPVLDPNGEYDIPQEALDRWDSALRAYNQAQGEIGDLIFAWLPGAIQMTVSESEEAVTTKDDGRAL